MLNSEAILDVKNYLKFSKLIPNDCWNVNTVFQALGKQPSIDCPELHCLVHRLLLMYNTYITSDIINSEK